MSFSVSDVTPVAFCVAVVSSSLVVLIFSPGFKNVCANSLKMRMEYGMMQFGDYVGSDKIRVKSQPHDGPTRRSIQS